MTGGAASGRAVKSPIIVAHRGLHDVHPENSLAAFRAAWDAGIEWCECDVRGSAEHEPFVVHDETLNRTTRAVGLVRDTPSALLRSLDLPRLSDVLDAMPARGRLLVEIKPEVSSATVEQTVELCDPARCVVQSFDPAILHRAATLRDDVRLELLVEDATRPVAPGPWRAINADFATLAEQIVRRWRDGGHGVGAWTVNSDADLRRAIALGLDTIITDRPLRARDFLPKIG